MPKVTVCIPSIRATTLRSAVDSVLRQTCTDWELVVVGQGEDTGVRAITEEVARADARVRYIHVAVPGVSRARNAGMRAARGELIAFTDDDCEARPDWLATFIELFDRQPDLGLVGGALVSPPPTRRAFASCPAVIPTEGLYDPVASGGHPPDGWDWVSANFAIRRSIAEQVGPFDECLGPGRGAVFPSGEDTDYKLRLEALGVKMWATPRAAVVHTYGYRYGLKAVLRQSRNYAVGNGGLAGKLTLLGDVRGRQWVRITARQCTLGALLGGRPHRLPHELLRLWYYVHAYDRCLREFRAEPRPALLRACA